MTASTPSAPIAGIGGERLDQLPQLRRMRRRLEQLAEEVCDASGRRSLEVTQAGHAQIAGRQQRDSAGHGQAVDSRSDQERAERGGDGDGFVPVQAGCGRAQVVQRHHRLARGRGERRGRERQVHTGATAASTIAGL